LSASSLIDEDVKAEDVDMDEEGVAGTVVFGSSEAA